jgi:hypothetical protein
VVVDDSGIIRRWDRFTAGTLAAVELLDAGLLEQAAGAASAGALHSNSVAMATAR